MSVHPFFVNLWSSVPRGFHCESNVCLSFQGLMTAEMFMGMVLIQYRAKLLAGVISGFVCLLRAAEHILHTYHIYQVYTLCMYTTIYIFSGPSAVTKGIPPTTKVQRHLGSVLTFRCLGLNVQVSILTLSRDMLG